MNHAATPGHTARYSSTEQHAAPGSTQHIVTHGGLLNAMTIPPVPLQHSPKFSDSHPWTSLICPYHFCSCFVSQGCARRPDIFDQDSLISPHFYPVLPGSTIFYHFFFFKVLSVYLTFQAISSRCSFKESRLVLTKFKGKNGCLEYPIHNFLVDFDPLFSDIRLKKFTKPPFSSVFTRFVKGGGGQPKKFFGHIFEFLVFLETT